MEFRQQLLQAYLQMLRIRLLEEQIHSYFLAGKLHGTTHLYIGEEAIAVGVCSALQPDDLLTSTHRGHGHAIAKGAELRYMLAELLGKATGYCKGRGGSMHIGHISHGNLGANGVVGGGHAIAAGAALAQKMKHEKAITVCFMGDGSINEGSFHEAMNLASIWKLPVLFVCENNQYGLSTPIDSVINIPQIADRATAYGIPSETIDGNRFLEVYQAALQARSYVLEQGPFFLVCDTYRIMGHSKSDHNHYRTTEEVDCWKEKDPLLDIHAELCMAGVTEEELTQVYLHAQAELEEAIRFAEDSSYPHPETLLEGVYADA